MVILLFIYKPTSHLFNLIKTDFTHLLETNQAKEFFIGAL